MSSSSTSSFGRGGKSRFIPLDQIEDATDNFHESNVLGQGGEAKVYLAEIKLGARITQVAVKHLKPNSQEFDREIDIISKIQHPNLVSLLGYCIESGQKILVYEYMEKGSLADYLRRRSSICLSWLQRLRICLDAARGLQHLHAETDEFSKGIIHRDVKPDNILLDKDWVAKISDFGMFKLSHTGQVQSTMFTNLKGTGGYYAPEYLARNTVTRKIDVYAFGVVLFQVLCLKMPWADRGEESYYWDEDEDLGAWALQNVDAKIKEEISDESLKGFTAIIGKTLRNDPKKRPTMDGVVLELEKVLKCQERDQHSTAGSSSLASETAVDREYCYGYIVLDVGEDETMSIEEMEVLYNELQQLTRYSKGSIYNDILNDIDRVVECLITTVAKAFQASLIGNSLTPCCCALLTLQEIFQNKRLGNAVKESTLACVITEIFIWLIHETVSEMNDAHGIKCIECLTDLMFNILNTVERTKMSVMLINLLRPLNPSLWIDRPSNQAFEERSGSFKNKVVDYLFKLIQDLMLDPGSAIKDLNPSPILQRVHLFMQELGVDEIKRPKIGDDPSWVIVNYVLLELVKLRGTAITGHLSMVPIHMEPQPIILGYIDLHIQSVEVMKAFCHDSEGSIYNDILKDTDRVVAGFTTTVAKTFQSSLTGDSLTICDYVLDTLVQIFKNERLARAVKESTLEFLMIELLIRCNDETLSSIGLGTAILGTLNELMDLILGKLEPTSVFVVLINLLRPPSPTPNQSSEAGSQLFYDAVVERLGKPTENLKSTIKDLNLDRILQRIHLFMQELGVDEIERAKADNDRPWRVVNDVLLELVKLRGTAIKGHLSMIPTEPQPILLGYIDLYIQTLGLESGSSV